MKDRSFWTKANRKTIVTQTDLYELPDGHLLRPNADLLNLNNPTDQKLKMAILACKPIWHLTVHYRIGMGKEYGFHRYFVSAECAKSAREKYRVGTEIELLEEFRPKSHDFDADSLSFETELSAMGRGEPPYFLIFEALQCAGVLGRDNRLSEDVLRWIGGTGESALSERFGENWEAVAALEYCVKHFHPTSLATLAARVQVADCLAETDYDAGYASRELEMIFSGAEELAIQSVETRKAAGKGGADASRKRRFTNLESLMQEIERLAGAVDLFSEDRILDQAYEAVREREPNFPKSKKTLDDYGTALRSEEPFKLRYEAVFRKNA
jgi:hypothetical protein